MPLQLANNYLRRYSCRTREPTFPRDPFLFLLFHLYPPDEIQSSTTMNPMNGIPGGAPLWQEARNAEGRVYYYNVQTKVTQWAKPVELMTPVEVGFNTITDTIGEDVTY